MILKIENLRLRTIIGINDWERTQKQEVVINLEAEFDGSKAGETDRIEDTVDYKKMNKRIIGVVESSQFFLLEKLVDTILKLVMEDPKIRRAKVKVDKPQALRFADSVSIEASAERAATP